jgi:hypothetical protein
MILYLIDLQFAPRMTPSPCRSSCRRLSVFCNRIYKDSLFSASKILLPSFQAYLKRKDPPSKTLPIYIYIKENHTHGSRRARVLSSGLKLRTQEHVLSSGQAQGARTRPELKHNLEKEVIKKRPAEIKAYLPRYIFDLKLTESRLYLKTTSKKRLPLI